MTEDQIKASLSDFDAFWLTLHAECRSEPVEGQIAVASVIRNRVGKRFGDTYRAVCLASKQFTCWNPAANANHAILMNNARLVVGDYAERTTLPMDRQMRQIRYLVQGIQNGDLLDNTHGCDHYLTKNLFGSEPPNWAIGQAVVVSIGRHVFLKLG